VSVAGFAGGLALDIRSGCEFAERLVAVFSTFQRGEEAETLAVKTFADKFEGTEEEAQITEAPGDATASTKLDRDARLVGAVYIRPLLWAQALERIREAPLLGYGMLNEPALINGDFPHYHEQYLSWLIWGGPLMLISGLVMLFAPLVTFAPRRSQDGAILTLAMIAPIAVSFLAATNLLHTVMLLGYVMTLGLLHALARERLRAERPKPERGGVSTETGYMGRV
jgi:hypothetical protein